MVVTRVGCTYIMNLRRKKEEIDFSLAAHGKALPLSHNQIALSGSLFNMVDLASHHLEILYLSKCFIQHTRFDLSFVLGMLLPLSSFACIVGHMYFFGSKDSSNE